MPVAGVIAEYNPLHRGHVRLLEEIRRLLGTETAVIGVMSGDFVQRGDFALLRRQVRARAAVESGMDLVLELPLPWAVSSAERFAAGGVEVLDKTGLVTHLVFGSESGETAPLLALAQVLGSEELGGRLRQALKTGVSFPAARQQAVEGLLSPETADLLKQPNNILGVEYCKALLAQGSGILPVTVKRQGTGYHGTELKGAYPSATLIRKRLEEGDRGQALSLMAPAMERAYREEEAAGRAPVFGKVCERAVLARLRSMTEPEIARLDEGREGLWRRLYAASRRAASVEAVLEQAGTKRYANVRLRRMLLWAYLGLAPGDFPGEVPYLRVLAANGRGRDLLSVMKKTAALPVVTKPGHVRRLCREAQAVFELESRAADLYALAYPRLSEGEGERLWREKPFFTDIHQKQK